MNELSADAAQREQRRKSRKQVDFDAIVMDAITEQPFGRIGNLSASGMLLISPAAPGPEAIYQLRVPLPESRGTPAHIGVGVQEQWQETGAADQVWAGYRIIAISDGDAELLGAWLEQSD